MLTTPIQAVDERVLPFSPEQIWAVLADAARYPDWYPPSVMVRVLQCSATLIATKFEIKPRGGRAFQCHVTGATSPNRLQMRYPGPFIVGTGEWRLDAMSGGTRVTYALDVVATGWLAVLLGKLLPLGRIHSKAMQEILTALEQEVARRNAR